MTEYDLTLIRLSDAYSIPVARIKKLCATANANNLHMNVIDVLEFTHQWNLACYNIRKNRRK